VTEHVTMQDGTEQELLAHLSETHHKGTRGLTDTFLAKMHRSLHLQEGAQTQPEHEHPDITAEEPEEDPQPAT